MKVGNKAPGILFNGIKYLRGVQLTNEITLDQVKDNYTLIVFGASWCPKCTEEIPQITQYYNSWKLKGVEVVFISLDTEEAKYKSFVQNFPWLSVCDLKGWNSKIVSDYYVFSTPTMFLIDNDNKIALRPVSVKQVDSWVNYYLKD